MQPEIRLKNQTAQNSAHRETVRTGTVTSQDGTTIGYRQLGRGPGVVVLHGTMESSHSHIQLAEALADAFTVYLPDRRGRGLSGPHGPDYSLQKEVEDMDALLTQTGAHNVFGISSGAMVWLQAALTLPAIHKAAIFEPPLIINNSLSTDFLKRYEAEIAAGNVTAALITAMKGAQMGPPIFNAIPRWILERMTKSMLASQDKKATAGDITMRMLAPTLHYDFQLVIELKDALERFKAIPAEVLLLGGSASPTYLQVAMNALEKTLPQAKRVTFAGLGHNAAGNTDERGKPEVVAQALRRFFA